MQKVIAITSNSFSPNSPGHPISGQRDGYSQAVHALGAIPAHLPPLSESAIETVLHRFDGFIFSGGGDISPAHWDTELHPETRVDAVRDAWEVPLMRAVIEQGKPLMAICRGFDVLMLLNGAPAPYQHLPESHPNVLHCYPDSVEDRWTRLAHTLELEPDTWIQRMLACDRLGINSVHHQGFANLGANRLDLELVAAVEGVIELVGNEPRGIIGIQGHPEALVREILGAGNPSDEVLDAGTQCMKLFAALIEKS